MEANQKYNTTNVTNSNCKSSLVFKILATTNNSLDTTASKYGGVISNETATAVDAENAAAAAKNNEIKITTKTKHSAPQIQPCNFCPAPRPEQTIIFTIIMTIKRR